MTMSNNGSLIIDKDLLQGKVLLLFGYLKRSSIRKERVKGQIIPINVFNQNILSIKHHSDCVIHT